MNDFYEYPQISQTTLDDDFWTPYISGIRDIMVPYCFDKFYETKYVQNFINVAKNTEEKHIGPPFTDGLVLETITGASTFLINHYDEKMDKKLDELISIIVSAQGSDGYLSTKTMQDYPEKRWGENDGDIIIQHDLYNHGTLIEAGVAHYKATKKTTLLKAAVKSAALICSYIGESPKHNVIPGHSLPEMAFIDLYDLFKNTRDLDGFAKENNVNIDDYLEIVRFWYDNRGIHEGRTLSKEARLGPEYNQDTMPFGKMRVATGHAVRAGLCYAGGAMAARKLHRDDYIKALNDIWCNVTYKKLHINGGIGSRHDIEGFDMEYQLPNDAYLETCAGIALSFWAAQMNLITKNSEYFDYFELSMNNNILGAVGEDFKTYYYENALVNDGTKNRWSWHDCPCCPPMLAKFYSSLPSYIYSFNDDEILVNLYIGSKLETNNFNICQKDKKFEIELKGNQKKISFRIPAYSYDFGVFDSDGNKVDFKIENGYAIVKLNSKNTILQISLKKKLAEIFMNKNVSDNKGCVCVMYGKHLMCAEGIDNNGKVDFEIEKNAAYKIEGENIIATTSDNNKFVLIPYYKRNRRVSENKDDSKMQVWFKKENMTDTKDIDTLYGYYKIYNK